MFKKRKEGRGGGKEKKKKHTMQKQRDTHCGTVYRKTGPDASKANAMATSSKKICDHKCMKRCATSLVIREVQVQAP